MPGREQENPQVWRSRKGNVGGVEGQNAYQPPDHPRTEQQPRDTARRGEHRIFHQELPDQQPPAGAQRGPDGDFSLPRRSARQQQVRHIDARDQQHHADQRLQNEQRPFETAAQPGLPARGLIQREVLAEKSRPHLGKFLKVRALHFLLLNLPVEHAHRGLRLAYRDARLQASEKVEPRVALVVQRIPRGRDGGLHHHRHPHLGRTAHDRAFKIPRADPDNRERRTIDANRRAHHGGDCPQNGSARNRTAAPPPDDRCAPVVVRPEHPAQVRRNAENLKIVPGHHSHADHLGAIVVRQTDALHPLARQAGKHGVPVAEGSVNGIGEGVFVIAAVRAEAPALHPQLHQFLRIVHRQRSQQHLVHQRENRRIRADPERQRENRRQGESRLQAELAAAVLQVLPGGVDRMHAVHFVDLLTDMSGIAEFAQRGLACRSRETSRTPRSDRSREPGTTPPRSPDLRRAASAGEILASSPHHSVAGPSTRVTACTSDSQRLRSCTRRRFPSGVMR